MSIKNKAYIVGIYEHPTRKAEDKSLAQLHAESAKGAIEDAGLSKAEVELRTLTLEGILAVQAGDNPRVVAEKLGSFVPPAERKSEDEGGSVSQMPQAEAA